MSTQTLTQQYIKGLSDKDILEAGVEIHKQRTELLEKLKGGEVLLDEYTRKLGHLDDMKKVLDAELKARGLP